MNTDIRDKIVELYDVDGSGCPMLFMDPPDYDEAICGVMETMDGKSVVAYDIEKVIDINVKMGMTYEEAKEYFYYNQIGAYVGEYTPCYISPIKSLLEFAD